MGISFFFFFKLFVAEFLFGGRFNLFCLYIQPNQSCKIINSFTKFTKWWDPYFDDPNCTSFYFKQQKKNAINKHDNNININ